LVLIVWVAHAQAPPPKPALAKDPGAFPGIGDGTQGVGPAQGKGRPRPVGVPVAHLPDGRPDFGGNGAWYPGFSGNIAETTWKGVKSADKHVDVPFLPEALLAFNARVESLAADDPEAQCLPVGIPRYMFDPYPFTMVQTKDQVIFLFEGDNYLFRIVPTGGRRTHPKNAKPTWMGDAYGWYEGDSLVVDVANFNNKSWLDQAGHSHTDKMHLIERYTRVDSLTLKYEVTIDDPGTYSAPWTTSNTVSFRPGMQLMESICYENEKDSQHMIGNRSKR
jgi:hypothetical protein